MRPPPSAIIERTTYLVSTIGDSVFNRTTCSIWGSGVSARDAVGAHACVVHQAIDSAEPLLQQVD